MYKSPCEVVDLERTKLKPVIYDHNGKKQFKIKSLRFPPER